MIVEKFMSKLNIQLITISQKKTDTNNNILIRQVHSHKIQYSNDDNINKIKFKIEFFNGHTDWYQLMSLNLKERKNQRRIESYIKQLQDQKDSLILSNGYNGSRDKDRKVQIKKQKQKKREKKQQKKSCVKNDKLKRGDPIDKGILIQEVISYEMANQHDEIFENDLLNRFLFELKMENNQVLQLTPKQINFMFQTNREKICNFIEKVEDYDHFLILSKIRVNESYLFTDYLGRKNISWNEIKQKKQKSHQQNQEEEIKKSKNNDDIQQFEKQLEKTLAQNDNEIEQQLQESEKFSSESFDNKDQQQDLVEPTFYEDKSILIKESKQLFKNGPLYTKKYQNENQLFRDKYFQIIQQRENSGDNLIDALNIYCETYFFTDREQFADLFVDRKFKLNNQLLENKLMKGLSIINFGYIVFDPYRHCFLTPEQEGTVEKDQIDFQLGKKWNMSPVILIGQDKSYILQYVNSEDNQVGCAIIKKVLDKWTLYDNRIKQPIRMQKEDEKLLKWLQNIILIEIYQMKMEIDSSTKEHIRKINHWYQKILKSEIPKQVLKYCEKVKKMDS